MELKIDFTEEERAVMKTRALVTAEKRLANELYEQAKASVVTESLKAIKASVKDRVVNAVAAFLTQERIERIALEMMTDELRHCSTGSPVIRAALENAVRSVADSALGLMLDSLQRKARTEAEQAV